jgi:predicted HNH restriction endonuclease
VHRELSNFIEVHHLKLSELDAPMIVNPRTDPFRGIECHTR